MVPTVATTRTLAPEGKHVISLFTQWVPHEWSEEPHREELEAYADRVIAGYDELAPGFADSVLHRQVIGPYEMEQEWGLIGGNIFHGELSRRAAVPHAAGARATRTTARRSAACTSAPAPRTRGGGVCGIPGVQLRPRDQARPQAAHAFPIGRADAR